MSGFSNTDLKFKSKIDPITLRPLQASSGKNNFWLLETRPLSLPPWYQSSRNLSWGEDLWKASHPYWEFSCFGTLQEGKAGGLTRPGNKNHGWPRIPRVLCITQIEPGGLPGEEAQTMRNVLFNASPKGSQLSGSFSAFECRPLLGNVLEVNENLKLANLAFMISQWVAIWKLCKS